MARQSLTAYGLFKAKYVPLFSIFFLSTTDIFFLFLWLCCVVELKAVLSSCNIHTLTLKVHVVVVAGRFLKIKY